MRFHTSFETVVPGPSDLLKAVTTSACVRCRSSRRAVAGEHVRAVGSPAISGEQVFS